MSIVSHQRGRQGLNCSLNLWGEPTPQSFCGADKVVVMMFISEKEELQHQENLQKCFVICVKLRRLYKIDEMELQSSSSADMYQISIPQNIDVSAQGQAPPLRTIFSWTSVCRL